MPYNPHPRQEIALLRLEKVKGVGMNTPCI